MSDAVRRVRNETGGQVLSVERMQYEGREINRVKYVDDRAGKTLPDSFEMQDYTVVDLLSYYQVNEHLRLNLDLKNLFDEEYEEGAYLNYAYPGTPRTVQAGFTYTY
ncbi:TonB-dependent siderophore receptor [compost metagenome]